jgi:hypothetical protein
VLSETSILLASVMSRRWARTGAPVTTTTAATADTAGGAGRAESDGSPDRPTEQSVQTIIDHTDPDFFK